MDRHTRELRVPSMQLAASGESKVLVGRGQPGVVLLPKMCSHGTTSATG